MNTILATLFATIAGTTLIINGLSVNVNDILANARRVVDQANVYQFSTALELYYSDHDTYPNVSDGTALVELLESEKYIRNRPLDPSVYQYQLLDNGSDYSLTLR